MPSDEIIETMARAIAPLAWAALGTGDTLTQLNRRKASLRHARAALSAAEAAGWVLVPAAPTEAMSIAGGKAHCEQIGCAGDFADCSHCHGQAVKFNGSTTRGDGCVNGSVAAYRAMLAAAGEPE